MPINVQNVIQAIVAATSGSFELGGDGKGPRYTVAISRDYGCGGDEIGRMLAMRLKTHCYNKEIINKVADRIHHDAAISKTLDEAFEKARDLWLFSLFTGADVSKDTYKRHLTNVLLSLGRMGGVIMGRGAFAVLGHTRALKVRITGSAEVCAKRVAETEKVSLEEAKKRIDAANHDRGKFVWDMFQVRQSEAKHFDLVINTDRLGDYEHVVEMLVEAAKSVTVGEAS